MSGEVLARRLLLLDAVYCGGAGVVAVALAAQLAGLLHVPWPVVAVAGAGTLGWALVLRSLARRPRWRLPVAAVAAANVVAAAGLAGLAFVSPGTAGRVLLFAVAIEVAAFAVGQVVALRR